MTAPICHGTAGGCTPSHWSHLQHHTDDCPTHWVPAPSTKAGPIPDCSRPTKRAMGQCMGCPQDGDTPTHYANCPALYPLQRQPGDEKDALMRLVAHVRTARYTENPDGWESQALDLISEAREEGIQRLDDGLMAVRAIMTRAVELVAARGGTMTAEEIERIPHLLACGSPNGSALGHRVIGHIAAQGARLAVVEDEREAAVATLEDEQAAHAETLAQVEALQAAGAVLSAHVDKTAGETPRHTCEDGADPTCLRCAEDDKARECDHALCGDLCTKYADPEDIALTKGYDDGIEAMRAACITELRSAMETEGMSRVLIERFIGRLEGATT